ncbi:MAG: zinc-binding dehydrogenase [Chloroflexi bacterium]|nr:zinc-binding dehydrogenase [Chloroflexota bacterium]
MKALYFENKLANIVALKIASNFTKSAAFAPFSHFKYAEVKEPEIPNPRWLKVKNKACGICGSDIHFIFMDMDTKCFPAATPGISRKYLGHEMVGEVVELGSEADGLAVGDRVSLRIDWPSCFQMEIDPPCRQCAAGNYMLCENLGEKQLPTVDTGGGFSPYMIMHRSQPYKVPNPLTDDEAVLLEPTAVAVHGVMKQTPNPGNKVLVIGGGTIGLLTIAVAKAIQPDAEIYCLARYPFQAEIATKFGAKGVILDNEGAYKHAADITGARYFEGYFKNRILLGGFDIIYDAVGNDRTIQNALRLVTGKGTVVILGINFQPGKIDYTPIWHQEIKVTGINCHATEYDGKTSFDIAAKLLGTKKINTKEMITHRFPLERYREAIDTFLSKEKTKAIKIVIQHS